MRAYHGDVLLRSPASNKAIYTYRPVALESSGASIMGHPWDQNICRGVLISRE